MKRLLIVTVVAAMALMAVPSVSLVAAAQPCDVAASIFCAAPVGNAGIADDATATPAKQGGCPHMMKGKAAGAEGCPCAKGGDCPCAKSGDCPCAKGGDCPCVSGGKCPCSGDGACPCAKDGGCAAGKGAGDFTTQSDCPCKNKAAGDAK